MAIASRATGRNGAAFPGYVAQRMAPGLAARLAADLASVCLVSGTNGKTSTAHYLVGILEAAGREVVANRSGANLEQGIASALAAEATLKGRSRRPDAIGVLEVDEAALRSIAASSGVTVIVLTNLFRDQLDRYGETDRIVRMWTELIAHLPPETVIVWCADDPRLRAMIGTRSATVSFGLEDHDGGAEVRVTRDVSQCPMCEATLSYGWLSIGHLGRYACPRCSFARPEPWLSVQASERSFDGQTLRFRWPSVDATDRGTREESVSVRLPTLGNAYNAAAAVTGAIALGIQPAEAIRALGSLAVPFARFEEITIDGRRVVLSLVKNPASLGEITAMIAEAPVAAVPSVLVLLSDNHQDGRDVSWYWDVDPTPMLRSRSFAIAGGPAPDFVLRCRYELVGRDGDPIPGFLGLVGTPVDGLNRVLAATPSGATCVVVATYTALLSLRVALASQAFTSAMPR